MNDKDWDEKARRFIEDCEQPGPPLTEAERDAHRRAGGSDLLLELELSRLHDKQRTAGTRDGQNREPVD